MSKPGLLGISLCLTIVILVSNIPFVTSESEEVTRIEGSVVKICQLVGDFDKERNQSTISMTFNRYGVAGADLGVSFEHRGKLIFLFGDTIGVPSFPNSGKDDSFAYTVDNNPDDGLNLTFYTSASGKFLPPIVPGLSQGPFEVPMEGIDIEGQAYVYFTTNHTEERTMGSSVLTKLNDNNMDFTYIYTLSTNKFLNVQVEAVNNSDIAGLPKSTGKGLLIWGSGEYRKSNPYLAYMPLESIEDRSSILYFKGIDNNGLPIWSKNEEEAAPLF